MLKDIFAAKRSYNHARCFPRELLNSFFCFTFFFISEKAALLPLQTTAVPDHGAFLVFAHL